MPEIIEEHINEKPKIILLKCGTMVMFERTGEKMTWQALQELINKKKIWAKDYYFDRSLFDKHKKQKKFLEDYKYAARYMKLFKTTPPLEDPIPDKFKGKIYQSDQAKKLGLV